MRLYFRKLRRNSILNCSEDSCYMRHVVIYLDRNKTREENSFFLACMRIKNEVIDIQYNLKCALHSTK
jgi:hypothetical protein